LEHDKKFSCIEIKMRVVGRKKVYIRDTMITEGDGG
jgi:hypothetical protein